MPRAREDFASFVRARWTELTDELVENGLTRAEAQQAVVHGLADCQAGWRRVLAEDNPEVVVRDAITRHVDSTSRDGTSPVEPVSDPMAAISGVRAARRRRVLKVSAIAGAAAVVTAAVIMIWPNPATYPQPPRHVEANPLPIVWWYGGELHLDDVVVEIPEVTGVARIGDAVWVDTQRDTFVVDPSGELSLAPTTLGTFPSRERTPIPHPELIPDTQVARSWTTTPAGNFIYAVQHRANEHAADDSIRLSTSGPWLILQCSLQAHPGFSPCQTITQLPADSAQPPIFEPLAP